MQTVDNPSREKISLNGYSVFLGCPKCIGRAFQRAELALKLKPKVEAKAKERQGSRNDLNIVKKSAPSLKTRDELAKIAGVSHDTLKKAEVIKKEGALVMPLSATKKPPPVRAAAWIKLRKCKSNGGWNVQQSHNLFLCFIFLFRYEIYKGLGIIFILV